MNTSLELIIIRGVPGSGKTTKAKEYKDHFHVEADMYFIDKDGRYVFDREKLRDAHEWCMASCRKALQEGQSVVVSNTFIRRWEVKPYVAMAKKYGAKLSVIEVSGMWKNEHGVPDETVERMRFNYESFNVGDFDDH